MGKKYQKQYSKQYFAGMGIILTVIIFLLAVFAMMCWTHKVSEYWVDSIEGTYGWSYEALADGKTSLVTPKINDDYTMSFPVDPDAVRITRTITETLPAARLEMYMYGKGIEVFLDDELLYSDFQKQERNEDGFLLLDEKDTEGINKTGKTIAVSLPEDYTGRKLSLITYFGEEIDRSPVFPIYGNLETDYATFLVESVTPFVGMTLCALLAVLLAVIFVLDIFNGQTDVRILLLGLFFVLWFLDLAYGSLIGSSSLLSEYMNLSFLDGLYLAPLYLYLALHMTKWRKYLLSGGTIIWFFYEGIRMYLNQKNGEVLELGINGKETLLLFIVMIVMSVIEFWCQKEKRVKKIPRFYILLFFIVSASKILIGSREWNGNVGMYLSELVHSALWDNYKPMVHLFTDICAIMTVTILILEFIRRTVETREMVSALEERSRMTLEGYNRMLEAEEATNSVRHEMRHHMTALMGMLKKEENSRACEYITSVVKELEQLPVGRYSPNILVNAIAGFYLDKAVKQNIEIIYNLNVPEELGIMDEDLCVFLTNMLENALKACERMGTKTERYIHVKMHVEGNFLFIGCKNSISEEKGKDSKEKEGKGREEHRRHGYGMAAMERIAEKYGSILKVNQSLSEFSVKSNLCMK